MSTRKNFLWEMHAEHGEISSKRVIGTLAMLTLMFLSIHGQINKVPVDANVFDMLVMLVLGAAGITAYEKIKRFLSTNASQPAKEEEKLS